MSNDTISSTFPYLKRMRDLREDNEFTQKEIADKLETSQTMYARYERGANELPIHHLITLCELYGVSTDYFLGRTNKKNVTGLLPDYHITISSGKK